MDQDAKKFISGAYEALHKRYELVTPEAYDDCLLESKKIFIIICDRLIALRSELKSSGIRVSKTMDSCGLQAKKCFITFIGWHLDGRTFKYTFWFDTDNFKDKFILLTLWIDWEIECEKKNWKNKPLEITKYHYRKNDEK